MKSDKGNSALSPGTADYVAAAAKSAVGAVPFVGSLLVEIAGTIIPYQRIDRIAKFAACLESRLNALETLYVKEQLENEAFTDLLEEGLRQAGRSLSNERREYIASLISQSLNTEDIDYQESKHLLQILGELNDIEIIWLRYFVGSAIGGDHDFQETHKPVLTSVVPTLASPPNEVDKAALQESYKDHLARLGLLTKQYVIDLHTKKPEFDEFNRTYKMGGYELTELGRLLLKQIGLASDENAL